MNAHVCKIGRVGCSSFSGCLSCCLIFLNPEKEAKRARGQEICQGSIYPNLYFLVYSQVYSNSLQSRNALKAVAICPICSRIYHHPLLTTFRRDRCRMGVDAVNRLLDTDYGVPDTDRFISGSICSCGARQEQILKEQHVERVRRDQAIASSVAHFSSRLTLCQTLAEYTGVLHEFFYLLYGAESLCLCLDTAWNSPKFDGREYLCCRITEERGCSAPVRVSKPMPLTAFGEEPTPTVCYFSPVCFQQV